MPDLRQEASEPSTGNADKPSKYLDPSIFLRQSLVLQLLGDGDFSVRILGHVVGRITAGLAHDGRVAWLWSITGSYLAADLQPSSGVAENLLQAKTALRIKFEAWLEWAQDQGELVAWTE